MEGASIIWRQMTDSTLLHRDFIFVPEPFFNEFLINKIHGGFNNHLYYCVSEILSILSDYTKKKSTFNHWSTTSPLPSFTIVIQMLIRSVWLWWTCGMNLYSENLILDSNPYIKQLGRLKYNSSHLEAINNRV